ncbi:DUF1272 domain-containing protein [Streptomyces sp. NPDC007346]|uniref:DUF1272 domain-containing protein n=1 Tax=Streptomyces sp. NPDC007346 TaxID=3154682 RepID=UPI0034548F8D
MLKMRPRCMKCTSPLGPAAEAYICSYECTWCPSCRAGFTDGCPNCGGEVVRRPRRTTGAAAIASRGPDRLSRFVRRVAGRA